MGMLTKLKVGVMRLGKSAKLKVSAKSPEILLAAGVVTFVGTVVVACKQTLSCEEILDQHAKKIEKIEEAKQIALESDGAVVYTEQMIQKDTATAYIQTGLKMAKHYAPVIILGAISIACFGASYGIMRKRNIGLSLAYAACQQGFDEYRARVRKDLGDEADKRFRYGYETIKGATVLGKDENGEDIERKEDIDTVPWAEDIKKSGWNSGMRPDGIFLYAPETSRHFRQSQDPRAFADDEMLNTMDLQSVKCGLQLDLDSWGHIALNEALRRLGMNEIPQGQFNGWMLGKGDPYIDFRVKPIRRQREGYGPGCYETVFLLDFNTCGDILPAFCRNTRK